MTSATHTGQCTCGQVRFALLSEPMFVHCCHCSWCQRETGSAFAVNALIETDRVELREGEVERVDTPSSSGKGQIVVRCPRCRVAVWSHYAYGVIGDALAFVRVGTLDDPAAVPPDIHIFTSSKQPWVELGGDAAVVPDYYKAGEHWPEESLARRAALADRCHRDDDA